MREGQQLWESTQLLTHEAVCDPHVLEILEVTYVDDETLMCMEKRPDLLAQKISKLAEALEKCFRLFSLRVNWSPNKTEALLVLRGTGSSTARNKLHDQGSVIKFALPEGEGSLRIVHEYRHLGSILTDDGSSNQEAVGRASSGMAAYAPISGSVFGRQAFSRRLRWKLAMSLTFSRLLYNVHVWSSISS